VAELTAGSGEPPPPNVGDAFGWAARDPEWIGKVLLMGLIGIIPIVGGLQQTGWLLTMLDNLRAGRYEVPPAGFRYATRGVWLWLAGLIYGLIFGVVLYGVVIVFVVVVAALGGFNSGDHGTNANPWALLLFPLFFVWFGIIGVVSLAVWIFVPAVIEFTDRKGLAGAFDIPGIFGAVRADPSRNLAAAGLTFVAYFIAGLGTYACWVGVIFTAPYALTVVAAVLRWYEVSVKPDALPAPTALAAR
jgi:uncharacterized protein DUF4013